MTDSHRAGTQPEPIERFKPTSGMLAGFFGLAIALGLLGYVLVSVHTLTGLRLGIVAVFAVVLVWVTQLRPRATAYPGVLVLRNSLRDTEVPLALVDEVSVRHTLNVWVGDRRYVCIGVGRSSRRLLKGGRRGSSVGVLGMERLQDYTRAAGL